MYYLIGALVLVLILGKFFRRTLIHLIGILVVEVILCLIFPNILVKFAELVAYVHRSIS